MRPPYETFTKPTCRGSIMLGTGCRSCEKCQWEVSVLAQSATGGTAAPPPPEDPRDARIRALEAEREALRAEVARKDEALRQIAEPRNWEEQDRARSIARAALGPWTPTHQLPGGAMVRQRAVNAYDGGRAIDLFEARDGTLYSRYPDDQRVRPLTPAEEAAYVEAAMGERT